VWRFGRARGGIHAKRNNSGRPACQPTPDLGETCRDWRQGDVFHGAKTFVFDWSWEPRPIDTTHGAVVVSQSCDASLPGRERIQMAPVVRLEHPNDVAEAAAGKRPQYVAIPRLGPDYFADLDGITTVFKTALLSCERVMGVATDQEIREFAFGVTRKFGRFAYPDEVVKCLRPLTKALQSKARKEQSPLGRVLAKVHSFRVQCEDWAQAPYELTLIVILEPGVVPLDPDSVGDRSNSQLDVAGTSPQDRVNKCANYLNQDSHGPAEQYFAWQHIVDAWACQCEEIAASEELVNLVGSVTAELASVDDFPLSRYLDTESLDLDYLSDSRKPMT
jgi:hypothetical protein